MGQNAETIRDVNGLGKPLRELQRELGGPASSEDYSRMLQNSRVCHERACVQKFFHFCNLSDVICTFQGPTWDRMPRRKWPGEAFART